MPGSRPYLKNKEHFFGWHAHICDIRLLAAKWRMNWRGTRADERGQFGDWCNRQGRDDGGTCENSFSVDRRDGEVFHRENRFLIQQVLTLGQALGYALGRQKTKDTFLIVQKHLVDFHSKMCVCKGSFTVLEYLKDQRHNGNKEKTQTLHHQYNKKMAISLNHRLWNTEVNYHGKLCQHEGAESGPKPQTLNRMQTSPEISGTIVEGLANDPLIRITSTRRIWDKQGVLLCAVPYQGRKAGEEGSWAQANVPY